jgi:hypothetical protein
MGQAERYIGYTLNSVWPEGLQVYPSYNQFLVLRANGWLELNAEYDETLPPAFTDAVAHRDLPSFPGTYQFILSEAEQRNLHAIRS